MSSTPNKSSIQSSIRVPTAKSAEKRNFFKSNTTLDESKQKFCRCVLHVADKEKGACLTEKAWYEQRDGHTCYNPYAVCAKSTGTSSRECSDNYDFDGFSDDDLIAYAQLHNKDIAVPNPYNRFEILENIHKWKANYKK